MKSRKSFAGLLCLLLAAMTVLALTGCGKKAPKSAAELMKAYTAETHDNYNMKMTMDMFIKMDFGGGEEAEDTEEDEDDLLAGLFGDMKFEIPMNVVYDADCAGVYAKGTMQMQAEMFGEQMDESTEMYVEQLDGTTTTYIQSEDQWVKTTDDSSAQALSMAETFMKSEELQNAEFEKDSETDTYIMKMSMGDLMKNESAAEMFGALQLGDLLGESDEIAQGVMDAMKDKIVTLTFDKDLNMTSFEMEKMEYATTISESGLDMNMAMNLEIKADFSKFGEIKEEDVKVPEDVKKNAVAPEDIEIPDDEDFDFDWGDLNEDEEPAETKDYSAVGEDLLGTINGKVLTAGPNDTALFTEAGFEYDLNDDGKYSFCTLKYAEDDMIDLYLSTADFSDTTIAEMEEKGFYGYQISTYGAEKLPNMTWGGLTFGASCEDVLGVYGEPSYKYDSDDFHSFSYDISENVELVFDIYDEDGITSVELNVYNW